MAGLRAKNAVVLAKVETTVGTDPTPTAAANAILVENPTVDPQVTLITTNEVTGSLDGEGPIAGGIKGRITFDVLMRGSGAAGTAPEWGPLMQACGWAETVTSTAVPSSAEVLASGGTTVLANLGSSATGTAQAYRGMPISFTSGVINTSLIADYATGKVATLADTMSGALAATVKYQIPVNVLYSPASAASTIKSLSIYVYMDGILYKFVGCRGTFTFRMDAGGIGRFSFDFMGHYVSKTDASVPATPVYDSTRPPIWRGGRMKINRIASAVDALNLTNGASVVMTADPNKDEGFDYAQHGSRDMQGNVVPLETLVATRDIMADLRAGTRRIISARVGSTAGNQFGVVIPAAHYRGQTPGTRDELLTVGVPFSCVGKDAGAFIACF